MADLTKIARTVLGSAAIAAIPASAAAITMTETEPNNTFPGQPATVGVTYTGTICQDCAPAPSIPPQDLIDFFHYTGLLAGGSFDLSFQDTSPGGVAPGDSLTAGLYTSQTLTTKSIDSDGTLVHLTGLIPAGGDLTFGITSPNAVGVEGYSITLNAPTGVPAPAAIVLLAAGLTAVGLDAARRRKRS